MEIQTRKRKENKTVGVSAIRTQSHKTLADDFKRTRTKAAASRMGSDGFLSAQIVNNPIFCVSDIFPIGSLYDIIQQKEREG